MRGYGALVRAVRLLATGLCILAGEARHAGPDEASSHLGRVRIDDGWTRTAVQTAIRGAQRRLRQESCQRVLTDFSDASGRPLRERLAALEQTSDGYLDLLYFLDGSDTPQCKRNDLMAAYTAVGSRVVFVCGQRLARHRIDSASGIEMLIIHEALHTLGLGENPPTSSQITGRVRFRCVD